MSVAQAQQECRGSRITKNNMDIDIQSRSSKMHASTGVDMQTQEEILHPLEDLNAASLEEGDIAEIQTNSCLIWIC